MSKQSDYHYLNTILQNNSSCISLQKCFQYYARPQNRNVKERKKNSWCSTEDIHNSKCYDRIGTKKSTNNSEIRQQSNELDRQPKTKIKIAFKPTIRLRNSFLNGKNHNNYSLHNQQESNCTFCHLHLSSNYSNQEERNLTFSTITLESFSQQNQQIIVTKCHHKFHEECFSNNIKTQLDQLRCSITCVCGKKISQQFIRKYSGEMLLQKLLKIQLQTIFQNYSGPNIIKQCLNCSLFWIKLPSQSNLPLCIYCLLQQNANLNQTLNNNSCHIKNRRLRSISYQ